MLTNVMGLGVLPGPTPQTRNDSIKLLIANKGTQANANFALSLQQSLGSPIEVVNMGFASKEKMF
jgi:hypothetical protein